VQTTSVATATMPLAAGFVGKMSASLDILRIGPRNHRTPVRSSWVQPHEGHCVSYLAV
jgi:hypothetical protein